MAVKRINVTFPDGAYRVSVPNFDGGEVVLASDYDALYELAKEMSSAFLDIDAKSSKSVIWNECRRMYAKWEEFNQ